MTQTGETADWNADEEALGRAFSEAAAARKTETFKMYSEEYVAALERDLSALRQSHAETAARLLQVARIIGCLEPDEDGKPACDPPCPCCAALAAEQEVRT